MARDIQAGGGRVEFDVVDALDEGAVEKHADGVAAAVGRIDVALNAVGIRHVQGPPFAEVSLDDFMQPIVDYLRTNYITAKAAASRMVERRGGVILTLSTPGSRMAAPGFIGYGTTCGAVETFSRILAGELGRSGVRVVCLRPDAIPDAVANSHSREAFQDSARRAVLSIEKMLAMRAEGATLLGRLPTLAEVAESAAFVASDRASATTGAIVNLTCGSVVD